MLSRTADHLFWMARYTERAENTARMLDVSLEAAMLPHMPALAGWRAPLASADLQRQFGASHGAANAQQMLDFMVRDERNPSSIVSCLRSARENARAVRGVLPTELWETINSTWLMLGRHVEADFIGRDPGRFFDWVRYRSHLSRGVTLGTMLRDEAFYFTRLGTFLERADNTARIVDMKFHGLDAASAGDDDVAVDFYYWAALLRSLSAFEIYRKVYRDTISPPRVAELLLLRVDMPRSLLACMADVLANMAHLRNRRSAGTERLAGQIHASLVYADIQTILEGGLHSYLAGFLAQIGRLGEGIHRDFLMRAGA